MERRTGTARPRRNENRGVFVYHVSDVCCSPVVKEVTGDLPIWNEFLRAINAEPAVAEGGKRPLLIPDQNAVVEVQLIDPDDSTTL
jgi:hypothetical protein